MPKQRFVGERTLMKVLGISQEQARQIRKVIHGEYVKSTKPEELLQYAWYQRTIGDAVPYCDTFRSVQKWVGQCLNVPHLIERQMCAIDEILNLYGVECIREEDGYIRKGDHIYDWHFWREIVLFYCNNGDTYKPTIAYDPREERFLLISWGDWYEKNMREVKQKEN